MSPVVLGLAGYARVGKDTAGAYLVKHYGFERRSFADTLRAVLYATDPLIPAGGGHYVSLRSAVDTHGWEAVKADDGAGDPFPGDFVKFKYGARALLQRLGTDAGRNILGDNVWVDAAMRGLHGPKARVVFTDVRFPNEADAIRAAGGRVVRLVRPGTGPVNDHPSETALDGYGYDASLYAEDVPQLHAAVSDMALRFGWERP